MLTSASTVNGVTRPAGTYISDAFIGNGTITAAQIGNAAITTAQINDLSATKLTAGTINVSNNINITGTSAAALNISSASSGERAVYTSTGVQIYDANGIRVKLGLL